MLQGYPFKDIGYILAPVRGGLHMLVNFAPFYQLRYIRSILEKLCHGGAVYPVGHVLQPVDFHASLHNHLQF